MARRAPLAEDPASPDRPARRSPAAARPRRSVLRRLLTPLLRGALVVIASALLAIGLLAAVDPPTTPYMWSESRRLGHVEQHWVRLSDVAPAVPRAVVAAEDADFCLHWGLDLRAIRAALAEGGTRGASTISQQVVKNVFLWQGRSWMRKALEAGLTPVMEALWPKRRILEVYLNVAEFGEGIFGIEAAARHHFGVAARDLTEVQAARLAAILPSPKTRDPAHPTEALRARARAILDGAATIAADGRARCFEGD
ncbi:monofunctional biosynthetic peptidoglycan transglycosylase [Rubellimicrobium sp. CFH 75288]|uniref:monofunctional biosynthetic peptidoglycan transglycosylase n=1 Tax=Rubellimicrobium sp. CFH 75288 TaxID=2697034 RepID=UPI001411D160|nr:monofunctional biosynthetic peptidoglycan transglycosylase [Rubellimicrobium sp. CFH 75288]NAZ37401.1 monofunctional biosynthetic peptidoglycan transglycosylase [Rubellimicrobium sp. CFH 75288]